MGDGAECLPLSCQYALAMRQSESLRLTSRGRRTEKSPGSCDMVGEKYRYPIQKKSQCAYTLKNAQRDFKT